MRATTVVALVAALAPAVLATPYFTAPVAGTVCNAGQQCVITWQDDGKAPTLAEFGDCTVAVCTGSQFQQTCLQQLAVTNAQTAKEVQFVPDPSIGENSKSYFIKMVSINTQDPAATQYKASAYSAMFELQGMTGKFNETIQQQIAGTAASSGAAGSASPSTSSAGVTSIVKTVTSTSSTAKATSSGTSANNNAATNGAGSVAVTSMGVLGAAALALAAIF